MPEASSRPLEPRAGAVDGEQRLLEVRLGLPAACQLQLSPARILTPAILKVPPFVWGCALVCEQGVDNWAFMHACVCLVQACDLSVYILLGVCVCASAECTHERVNGMWALGRFAH